MTLQTWMESEVHYGEELVRSAVAGGRNGRDKALAEEPVGALFERSARTSLPWILAGASVGVLSSYWGSKRKLTPGVAALGIMLGAALGFGANLALRTRHLTEQTLAGAMRNMSTVRDAHWLARHPIDYA